MAGFVVTTLREETALPQRETTRESGDCLIRSSHYCVLGKGRRLTYRGGDSHAQSMRRLIRRAGLALLALVCCGSSLAADAGTADSTQRQIALIENRLKERPHDFIAFTRLGDLQSRRAHETGDLRIYLNAEAAFTAALKEFPDYAGALAGLASVRMALHRFAEAADLAERVLQHDRNHTEARLLLVDAQIALGNEDAAAVMLAKLADSPAVFARRAELSRLRGDNAGAIRLLLRASDESDARGEPPPNVSWYRVRAGEMLFASGKFDLSEEQYRRALDSWPESYAAAEHVAELLGAREKFDEAVVLYEKLIAQSSRPDLQQALGDLYVFMRKPEQAEHCYDKALAGYLASVQRGEVHFIHHLAGFYSDARENGKEAVKWARKDLELRHTPAAHDALAWALYRAGQFGDARAEIDAALRTGISNAHILNHASFIYSAAGDLERGRQCMRETAAVNPRYNSFHVHR